MRKGMELMTAKTMAEVLAEHRISPDFDCECGVDFYPEWDDHDALGEDPGAFLAAFEAHQAAALSAAGFGLVTDAKAEARKLKSVRGELKTLGRNLDSWESEGHTTATIRFLRQWIGRATKAVS